MILPTDTTILNLFAPLNQLLELQETLHNFSSLTGFTAPTTTHEDSDSSSEFSAPDEDPVAYDEQEYRHPWLNAETADSGDSEDPEPAPESPGRDPLQEPN